jgi:hypothetical protein
LNVRLGRCVGEVIAVPSEHAELNWKAKLFVGELPAD